MKSLYTCLAAALLTMVSVGCSSSSTPAATSASGLDACKAYCTKMGSKCGDAGIGYASTTECEQSDCTAKLGTEPAACQSSAAAYFNCLAAQTDICALGCLTEMAKMSTDCPAS